MLAILPCHISLIPTHISDCCQFSDIHISQGSVSTHLRCGGIFKYEFVANLPLSLSAKELWKSVLIWGSYGQEFSVLFFIDSRCRSVYFTVHHKIALVETQSTDHSWENDLFGLILLDWLTHFYHWLFNGQMANIFRLLPCCYSEVVPQVSCSLYLSFTDGIYLTGLFLGLSQMMLSREAL